ncbi:MAG TPA: ribonuclease P protein component [Roseobacter sp.]|nr:ribonuclease P protein component [Roseobacter sp.]HEC70917.1 ribonuclease P protein component [Roseobacter sp.]|tara:strand:- start:881 stop:1276 length:396 start_codon:yes stop_codon:yes gene_type:complete
MGGTRANPEDKPPAVSLRVQTLKNRPDFQRATRAPRVAMPGFILQMRQRAEDEAEGIRIGYTCSKKVGNAVARNRAKRRLREIARLTLTQRGLDGMDYVLVGRKEATANLPFDQLQSDLSKALGILHGKVR